MITKMSKDVDQYTLPSKYIGEKLEIQIVK